MKALPPVLLFLPFVVMGMRLLRTSCQSLFASLIHKGILSDKDNGPRKLFTGLLGSLFFLSTSIYNRLLLNLLQGRLISSERAYLLSTGSLLGSYFFVFLFLKTDHVLSLVAMLLACLGVLWSRALKLKLFSRALFGLGLIFFGLSLGDHFLGEFSLEVNNWQGLLLGLTFSLALRSSGVALIVGLWSLQFGQTVAPFMYGAGVLLGGGIPELLLGQTYSSEVKQLSLLNFLQRILGFTFAIGFALWLNGQKGSITKIDALHFYGLSIFIGTMISYSFQSALKKMALKFFPDEEYPENPKLDFRTGREDTSAAFSLIQARRQVGKLSNIVERLFSKVRTYLENERSSRTLAKIKDYERVTDNIRLEVEEFLLLVMEQPLSSIETKEIKLLLQLVGDLEGVADYLDKIATYKTKLEEDQRIPEELLGEFFVSFTKVEKYLFSIIKMVGAPNNETLEKLNQASDQLKAELEELRVKHTNILVKEGSDGASLLAYSDMLLSLRKIRGHARHISNALA